MHNYLAIADPAGNVKGLVALVAGFTITVPSTNGANPGRNLKLYIFVHIYIEIMLIHTHNAPHRTSYTAEL